MCMATGDRKMIKITIEEAGKITTYTSDSAIRSIEMWDGTAWTFGTVRYFADLAAEAGHIVTDVLPTGDMVEHAIATDGAPIDPTTMADYLTSEANRK